MWILSIVLAYVLVGLLHGIQHMANIYTLVTDTGRHEGILRELVSMYEFTPKGAEYYAELQDLHVRKAELLAEYKLLQANKTKYQLQTFLLGFALWPYYIFSISRKKTTMKREMGR